MDSEPSIDICAMATEAGIECPSADHNVCLSTSLTESTSVADASPLYFTVTEDTTTVYDRTDSDFSEVTDVHGSL